MSGVTRGRALVVLVKDGGRTYNRVYLKSPGSVGTPRNESAYEEISTDLHFIAGSLVNMDRVQDGCTVTITFSYAIHYTKDYWGECDVDVEYDKVKVIARSSTRNTRRKRKAFYIPKNAR